MKEWYVLSGEPFYQSGMEQSEFDVHKGAFAQILDESPIAGWVRLCGTRTAKEATPVRAIMQNRTNDSVDSTGRRQLLTTPQAMQGVHYVGYRGEWYLAVSDTDDQDFYEKTVLTKCNVELKFKSPQTGEAVIYPVYMTNATKYSSGEAHRTQLTIETSQFSVLIPCNEETLKLRNGFRFLVDMDTEIPTAWKVSQVDTISYRYKSRCMLMLMVVADEFNPVTDDAQEMIADCYTVEDRLTQDGQTPPTQEEKDEGWWG